MASNPEATPYLLRGYREMDSESPTLRSSSRYLNSPELREWIATHYLRRSNRNIPTPSDAMKLGGILRQTQDTVLIEELIAEERKRSPQLDAWFSEGFVSTYTKEDLGRLPKNSVGGIFYGYLAGHGYQVNIVPPFEPKTQFEYYLLRNGQVHDWEHILCGGGFDVLGELVPYFMRLANIPRFVSPRLAEQFNAPMALGSGRIFMRTALHYHEGMPTALDAMRRGMKVGEHSGPLFMAKYEDVLGLSVAEAREALRVMGVEEADSSKGSSYWEEFQ